MAVPTNPTQKLSSLTEWAKVHIPQVYEASSAYSAKRAIDSTFSPSLRGTVNGKVGKTRENFLDSALKLQKARVERRKVVWQSIVEVPDDDDNRSGTVGAVYSIIGIEAVMPGNSEPTEFERHKCVVVRIESQSDDPSVDSRMIVDITAVEKKVEIAPTSVA